MQPPHEKSFTLLHARGSHKWLSHFADKQRELQKILSSSNWLFYMFLLVIFVGGAVSSALYHKMTTYEKKAYML